MKSRILFAVSISVFLILYYTKEGKACFPSPTEMEEYRYGLFVPYSKQLRTFDGMYFSYFNMHDVYNSKGQEADIHINIDEWYSYIGGKVDKYSIYELLYNVSPTNFSDAQAFPKDQQWKAIHQNAFYKYITEPAHKKVLNYIRHLKTIESYTGVGSTDPWDDNYKVGSVQNLDNDTLAAEYSSLGDDNFLKSRYLYLDIRTSNYVPFYGDSALDDYSDFDDRYNKLMALPGKTIVKGWAAYFNGLDKLRTDPAKGNYLLAQAFNQSNEKKSPIYRHFDSKLAKAAAQYARNNRELANIYSLVAMNNPAGAVDMIDKIYHLDPANPNLHFLMVREISKLEDRICSPKYTGFGAQVLANYDAYGAPPSEITLRDPEGAYLNKWKALLSQMLTDSLPKDRFFFHLCMAHTCLVGDKPEEARAYLDSAKKYPPADPELLCQYKLTELAIKINGAANLDSRFENEILPTLKWLDKNKEHLENADLVLKQVHLLLSKKYEQQGNRSRAIMCRIKYNWFYYANTVPTGIYFNIDTSLVLYMQEYCSGSDVEGFVNTLTEKSKSPFEKYYTDSAVRGSYIYNQACDIAGSDYMREADYTSGLRMFSLLDDGYWHRGHIAEVMDECMTANPFFAHPEDNHARSMTIVDSTKRYNKATYARRLNKLLKEDINKPDSLLTIADAIYNISYFGNSWIVARNSWSAYDNVFSRENWRGDNILLPKYYDFYACRRARQWYQQAYSSSRNREVKAKALIMMAQCDKNYAFMLSRGKYHGSTALFDQFARSYADTRYYQDLTSDCEIDQVKGEFYQFNP